MGGRAICRRRVGFVLGACALAGAALGLGGDAAGADLLRFSAGATADGGRLQFSVPGASVSDQIIDGGGPVASAGVDSLGASSAFASLPYPGELGVIGPGVVASLIGAPQPPPYPFIAMSRHPGSPAQQVEYPGYQMVARSDAETSSATATAGGAQGDNRAFASDATASAARTADGITAEAANRFEGFAAGPLRIASVVSSARVTRQPDAEPERKSTLQVSGVSVDGQAFGFSEQGFVMGESTTPLPSSDPLLTALKAAGITMTYLKAETTPNGIIAPGLRIVMAQAIPGSQTTGTLSLTLGRAQASVAASTESVGLPSEQATAPVTGPDTAAPVAAPAAPPTDPAGTVDPPAASAPVREGVRLARTGAVRPTLPALETLDFSAAPDPVAASPGGPDPAAPAPRQDEVALVPPPRPLGGVELATRIDADKTFFPLLLLAGLVLAGGLQAARLTGGAR
jgi:hypothetical protein